MLNAPTRDSAAAGMRRWFTVESNASPNAVPRPAASAAAATAGSGSRNASASGGNAKPNVVSVETSSGRRGRRPRASRPPSVAPPP